MNKIKLQGKHMKYILRPSTSIIGVVLCSFFVVVFSGGVLGSFGLFRIVLGDLGLSWVVLGKSAGNSYRMNIVISGEKFFFNSS